MSVSQSALDYLWIEAVPLTKEVSEILGHKDNINEEIFYRIEKHGFNVGKGLAYLLMREQTQAIGSQLDVIKFVCKDLWQLLFHKQIDSLKTNHRDAYVLIDTNFTMCQRMSSNKGPEKTAEMAKPYLWLPAGIIRGFLHVMGIECRVDFDAFDLPLVEFSIFI
ncbi:Trs33 protein [Starmerella bacillaris]|uniref:Trs33 protein n=1 Tax=Starmerella bacillaris TaxID=1247836 RepID=A0AAV5RRT1_STABA|nr:Trs33 protein [Starmerella bacillaris]